MNMDDVLAADTRKNLLHIDDLEGFERQSFLRSVLNTTLKDFSFIDVPECSTPQQTSLQQAVLTFFTLAVKHNFHPAELQTFLANLGVQQNSIDDLLEHYTNSREDIRRKLAKYGHDIPWVTNVNWKLSSVLRSGKEELNAELVYKVSLEGTDETAGRTVIAAFDCTIEELQNLTAKFKEIERNCHRIADNK